MTSPRRLPVSGAGVAGLSTGITLGNLGHEVTIVERAAHLRTTGSAIDVRGEALEVADRLGLLDSIRAHRVRMTESSTFIDPEGNRIAGMPVADVNDSPDDTEISRKDLAAILHAALPPNTGVVFNESIKTLHDDGETVQVGFASGNQRQYDLVVGADGLHSATRRLIFGPESDYLKHLGYYVALTELAPQPALEGASPLLNLPDRMVGIVCFKDSAVGVFTFRSPWIDYDYHDPAASKQILLDAYAGHQEWRIPELLDAVRNDPELYFDSVSQIQLPSWHSGRVVLVGDAAHCASLLSGRGTSIAMTGAWFLAESLRQHPADLAAALTGYEHLQRPRAERAQATAAPGGELLVPATQAAIDARNEHFRSLEPARQ